MASRFELVGLRRFRAVPQSAATTRDRILDAAERLFAAQGIDGTTITAITEAAGARNKSAVGYHFGSKLALLEAVLRRHLPDIDRHRDELLDRVEAAGPVTIAGLVEALVLPVAAKLDTESGVRYVQIQASLLGHPDRTSVPADVRDPGRRHIRLRKMMRAALPPRPDGDVLNLLISSLVFHGLADFARSGRRTRREREEFVAAMQIAVEAILETPRHGPAR
jgi:AcrR family transcriptional regulator